ncbi:MAG: efflux RND transporter periplasmic adaptor subunit [Alphaproteobacteria bacterium]|nr:efflux RND transporter periplasmic adaptor subunit [Alphaproteobacteria bacterium]
MLTLLALLACGEAPPPEAPPLRPVRTIEIQAPDAEQSRTLAGVAQASEQSRLSFNVAGTLARLAVKVGERVQPGQVVAEIDCTIYELQLSEARAGYAQAQAQLQNAESKKAQTQQLFLSQSASKSQWDDARANLQAAQAQVASVGAKVQQARSQVDYCTLSAPVAGAVAEVQASEGENLNAGTPVVTLSSGDKLEVAVAVPETLIGRVRGGEPVAVSFPALGLSELPGTITEVGVATAARSSTFPVVVQLGEGGEAVRAGMAAEVRFRFEAAEAEAHVRVPAVAVAEDQAGRFGFVVEPGADGVGVVRRRELSVGPMSAEGLAILDGLEPGELLITAGVSQLRDGMQVKLPVAHP